MRRIALLLAGLALAGAAAADDAAVRLGGHVTVTETVEGPLHALGGHVTIDAPIKGDASLAGGHITVNAAVQDSLHAAGGNVVINAPVGGDVTVMAGKLELGPEAKIAGKLSFKGGELRQDPAAQVTGPITQSSGRSRHRYEYQPFGRHAGGWLWTGGLVVLAALIAAGLPGPSRRMAQELRERPWLTTLVGMVALTSIPVAAVLLMVTIIGIPIGLLGLALWAALLLVGYVWLAVVIGGLLLDRVKPEVAAAAAWRAGAAMVAMLAIALLTRVPFVGGFIVLAAIVVGVGMVVGAAMRRQPRPAMSPAA